MNIEAINQSTLPTIDNVPEACREKFEQWFGTDKHTLLNVEVPFGYPDECSVAVAYTNEYGTTIRFARMFPIGGSMEISVDREVGLDV